MKIGITPLITIYLIRAGLVIVGVTPMNTKPIVTGREHLEIVLNLFHPVVDEVATV